MRLRSTLPLLAFAMASACNDSTGPEDPQMRVALAPFSSQVVVMEAIPNSYWSNEMSFFTPAGVAPVLTKINFTATSGAPVFKFEERLSLDSECSSGCTRMAWQYSLIFNATGLGEAKAEVCLVKNPSECSSFKIIVRSPAKG